MLDATVRQQACTGAAAPHRSHMHEMSAQRHFVHKLSMALHRAFLGAFPGGSRSNAAAACSSSTNSTCVGAAALDAAAAVAAAASSSKEQRYQLSRGLASLLSSCMKVAVPSVEARIVHDQQLWKQAAQPHSRHTMLRWCQRCGRSHR
jgi:hypothetical protein